MEQSLSEVGLDEFCKLFGNRNNLLFCRTNFHDFSFKFRIKLHKNISEFRIKCKSCPVLLKLKNES